MLLRLVALLAIAFVSFWLFFGAIVGHTIWPVVFAIPLLIAVGFVHDPAPIADTRYTRYVGIGTGIAFLVSLAIPGSFGAGVVELALPIAILIAGGMLSGWRQHEISPGAREIATAISMSMIVALVAVVVILLVMGVVGLFIHCSGSECG